MTGYFLVGLGGFIGSAGRYAVMVWLDAAPVDRFPWATFAVNCLGCLLIGLLAGALARTPTPDPLRLFLIPGVLGGFTTFSAFGMESLAFLRRGETSLALVYILGSVLAGIAAVWIGLRLAGGANA